MRTPRARTWLTALGIVVAAGSALLLVGPRALGGPTSILAVSGNSMEPRINAGDLILVRAGGPYRVGQIVAYHNIPAAATFLHRIVGIRGTGFVMKGDHNGWTDPGTAEPNQVVGSLWIRIPGAGSAFTWVADPLHGALLAAAAAFPIGLREILRRRVRRRTAAARRGDDAAAPVLAPPAGNVSSGPWTWRPPPGRPEVPADIVLKAALAAALIGAAACVFLGVVSFSRSASIAGSPSPLFRQSGSLSYRATASPGPVYPTGRVTSPTPVYLHLVKAATFSFRYHAVPVGQTTVSGSARMSLVLQGNTGWTRVLALTAPRPFNGTAVTLRQHVSIARVRSLLATVESLTASPDSYSLAILPIVVTHGAAGGRPFVRRFTPRFIFDLTDAEMTLAGAPSTPAAVTSALTSATLETATPGGPQAAELAVGPLRLPVDWWRVVALMLGSALLAAAGGLALAMHRRLVRRGEPALISAKHRDLLVPLATAPADGERHVTVRSFDDLVRVARRHETTILHHEGSDGAEHYLLLADGVTFRYRSSSTPATEPPAEARATGTDAA
jgi:signal peptidase I